MRGLVNEGSCPACGKCVRYCGYVPRIYLCADCGGEEPHAEGVVERDGRLYYEPDDELVTDGGLGQFGVDVPDREEEDHNTTEDYRYTRPQCRALTADGDRCSNPIRRTDGNARFCPRHHGADPEVCEID